MGSMLCTKDRDSAINAANPDTQQPIARQEAKVGQGARPKAKEKGPQAKELRISGTQKAD